VRRLDRSGDHLLRAALDRRRRDRSHAEDQDERGSSHSHGALIGHPGTARKPTPHVRE